MPQDKAATGSFAERVDAVEAAYEFMLAYAAQGRTEEPSEPGHIRDHLTRAAAALDGIADAARKVVPSAHAQTAAPFIEVLADDARKAQAAIRFVLARPVTSQVVDNLNGSIHLRALLTDLFIIDETLKG